MSEMEVRDVSLGPMRVASFRGFGPNPEESAWRALVQWGQVRGLLGDLKARHFFGFNNPNPEPGNSIYGYEQWMVIGPEVEAGDGVEIKDFRGGLFAVTRCRLVEITEVWGRLVRWCMEGGRALGDNPLLEECLTPELFVPETDPRLMDALFDIYLPLRSD